MKMDFDPLSNPNTSEAFEQNFLNIKEVHYFDGFEIQSNGLRNIRKPIFRKMNKTALDSRSKLLCKLEGYENEQLEIRTDKSFPNTNSVFLMEDE